MTVDTPVLSNDGLDKIGALGDLGKRCFVLLDMLGCLMESLVDTGSDRSYLGTDSVRFLKKLGLDIHDLDEPKVVQLADGSVTQISEFVEVPVVLEGEPCMLKFLILPNLAVDSLLGLDSLRRLGIVIDVAEKAWHFGSDTSKVFKFLSSQEAKDGVDSALYKASSLLQLSSDQKEALDKFLCHELPLFDAVAGRTNLVKHKIDVGNASPIKQRYYPVSPVRRDIIHTKVKEMLWEGLIESSASPWASPIVMVKKPSGDFRLCVNYRKVNMVTRRDSYPLPYMESILSKLREAMTLGC